jgi:hypothetical protein
VLIEPIADPAGGVARMTHTELDQSWFLRPPVRGKWAVVWIVAALPVATIVRSTMMCPDPIGECCTPLFIFVMLTAVMLGWIGAVVATLLSAVVSIALFVPRANGMEMAPMGEFWSALLFFFYCAMIIGAVEYVRRSFARYSRVAGTKEASSGVVFSIEEGQAWANWPGHASPIRLGPDEEVTAMMKDFVAQVEVAHRLARRSATQHGEAANVA